MGSGVLSSLGLESQGTDSAHVAQLVERILGKDEVTSSILVMGSTNDAINADITRSGDSKWQKSNFNALNLM